MSAAPRGSSLLWPSSSAKRSPYFCSRGARLGAAEMLQQVSAGRRGPRMATVSLEWRAMARLLVWVNPPLDAGVLRGAPPVHPISRHRDKAGKSSPVAADHRVDNVGKIKK